MITFVLLLIVIGLIFALLTAVGVGVIALLADFLVCIALIVFLVKLFTKKKRVS